MEKLDKTISADYLAVKIYQEDLESIEAILKEGTRSFNISTEDYKFDTADECIEHYKDQSLKDLCIMAIYPVGEYDSTYISIRLKKTYISINCTSSDSGIIGKFYRVKEILSSAERRPRMFYSLGTVIGSTLVMDAISFIVPSKFEPILITAQSIFFCWFFWVFYIRMFKSSDIVMDKRALQKGFIQRNKDALAVNIIVAIVTFILTTTLVNHIHQIEALLHSTH